MAGGGGMWHGVRACDKGYGNMAGGGMGTYCRSWEHVAGGGVMW